MRELLWFDGEKRARFHRVRVGALCAMLLAGCLGGAASRQADLTGRSVAAPTMMVARPLPRTLYIVLDPMRVPDRVHVRQSQYSAIEFRTFFKRSLRTALAPYFQRILVVDSPPLDEPDPHFVADVRLDGIEMRPHGRLGYAQDVLQMQWGFAIRPSEADDYLFSFTGTGVSETEYSQLELGFQQMMLSALTGLVSKWTEGDVFQHLIDATGGNAAPTPAPSTTRSL
mgnify:FL=1